MLFRSRFTFRAPVTLQGTTVATGAPQTVALSSTADVFYNGNYSNNTIGGTRLIVDSGANTELVYVTAVSGNNITASFDKAHASGAVVRPAGAFGFGVIPTNYTVSGTNVGSTGYILKLLGDINDDGNMVLVIYRCELDPDGDGTNNGDGILTRQEIPYDLGTPAKIGRAHV